MEKIKKILLDEYNKIKSDAEISYFINDLSDVLNFINEEYLNKLVDHGLYSKEKAIQKNSITEKYLKQASDNVIENIKLSVICKKAVDGELIKTEIDSLKIEKEKLKIENDSLKIEKENLTNKVRKAQELINEAQIEVERTKKSTLNNIKKNMQISRDRIVAIANTTFTLGDQINNRSDAESMEVTLNNIVKSIGILTDEFSGAGLWDPDEYKPTIKPILLEDDKGQEKEVPKKTNKKRTGKKALEDNNNDENIEQSEYVLNEVKNDENLDCTVMLAERENNNTVENFEKLNQINISELSNSENRDN